MKKFAQIGVVTISVFSIFALTARAQTPDTSAIPFYRNLSLGSNGEDVRALQKILNQDAYTRIQGSESGSPGLETTYFGLKTKDAVARFQEKYAVNILYPVGLTTGTGVVGSATRAYLSQMVKLTTPGTTHASAAQNTHIASNISPAQSPTTNPNLKNLDKFLDTIEGVATKQGLSASSIATIKGQIIKDAATTTDMRAQFLKMIQSKNVSLVPADKSLLGNVINAIQTAFYRVFMPEKAAAVSLTPFGGALLYPFFCTCSYTWLIALEPLPPSFAVLLSYIPFTQGFLSYNIPYTNYLLGKYTPGAGSCLVYIGYGCLTIPSEGMITPEVGSSTL